MNLKSFGCSFIYGSELSDDVNGLKSPSQLTWPALLSKQLLNHYSCYAVPGSGNLQILEQVLSQSAVADNSALFVIGWTWIDRFDYTNSSDDKWNTITPTDETTIANTYYRDLHSQYKDKLSTLMCIRLAIDTLNQKNCPFIMTYVDDLIFETKWHTTPAIIELQNYIRPHMTTFEGRSFLEWSKNRGFKISKKLHPLDDAHAAASKYIYKSFV